MSVSIQRVFYSFIAILFLNHFILFVHVSMLLHKILYNILVQ